MNECYIKLSTSMIEIRDQYFFQLFVVIFNKNIFHLEIHSNQLSTLASFKKKIKHDVKYRKECLSQMIKELFNKCCILAINFPGYKLEKLSLQYGLLFWCKYMVWSIISMSCQ